MPRLASQRQAAPQAAGSHRATPAAAANDASQEAASEAAARKQSQLQFGTTRSRHHLSQWQIRALRQQKGGRGPRNGVVGTDHREQGGTEAAAGSSDEDDESAQGLMRATRSKGALKASHLQCLIASPANLTLRGLSFGQDAVPLHLIVCILTVFVSCA